MKKTFIVLTALTFLIACGNNASNDQGGEGNTNANTGTTADAPPAAPAVDPDIEKGLALVGQSDCLTCHKIVDKHIGPAYEAVAAKYPVNDQVIDSLAQKIIKGGAGNWGAIPMTPHPDLKPEDARAMVKYIMSLKK